MKQKAFGFFGEKDREGRALTGRALYLNIPLMRAGNGHGDTQAQAVSRGGAGFSRVTVEKFFKDPRKVFGQNTSAAVTHLNFGLVFIVRQSNFYFSPRAAEFDGVINQIKK